jgi:8-oxo-dGTP pyrophosphatase MutT (NUDIX family)
MTLSGSPPVFGTRPEGVACTPRRAAYAVIRRGGLVAAHKARQRDGTYRLLLPGGRCEAGESAEDAVQREIREELGRAARLTERIGEAVQYYFAGTEGRWYVMTATFFIAELEEGNQTAGEFELLWVDPQTDGASFFHASHAWAVLFK